jgi:hypothetical protein
MEKLASLMEFQALMEEKNHKAVILKLDEILKSIPSEIPDNKSEFETMITILQTLSVKEKDDSIPRAVEAMGDAIVRKIEALIATVNEYQKEEDPKEWTFDIIRDNNELIKTVKAKAI